MAERTDEVTFNGNPLTLMGERLNVGDKAPNCALLTNDLAERSIEDYRGKVCLISVVPSLDTGVCDKQTRRFNEEISKLGDDVVGLTISADLPFAQKRWCGAAGIDCVTTLSDHRDMAFGKAFGTHIKELRLDARAVFVIDKEGIVRYVEYVPEMTDHPNYEAALEAARNLTK
jgi:thiol peroxidase